VSFTTSGMVWFINNNAGACTSSCDGRLSHPFTSLANFQAVNDGVDNVGAHSFHPADNDNIFIYESSTGYVGPVTLRSGQKLIGQDATASLETITGLMPPADSPSFPTMNSGNATITKITSAGNGINVSTGNNTIRGLTVGTTTGVGISSGASFGTLTISDTNMDDSPNRGGQALGLTSGTLAATFANIRSTNSSAAGVSLTSVSGSLTSSGVTSITNPGTIGISVGTSSATLNFGTTTSTQSGGTGISLLTNTGTITFGALTITPDANQRGLLATDNTNTITIPSGTVTTSGGTAVEITRSSSTTPLAVSLTSVSANGGSSGIFLKNTSGSFTVTGTSGSTTKDGTGGTIQNMTGASASPVENATIGIGVYLNNVTNVTLNHMNLHDFSNYGIIGTTVTGFTLTYSIINGTNGDTVSGVGEGSVYFTGLSGSATVSDSDFSGGRNDTFHIFNNSSQTLDRVTFTTCSFAMTSTDGGDALGIQATGGTFKVTVQSSTFTAARADLFQFDLHGTMTADLVFGGGTNALGNTLTNNNSNIVSGGGGVTIGGGGPTNNVTLTYNISHNSMKGSHGAVLAVSKGTGTGASFTGTIDSNVIGTQGTAASGSTQGEGIAVFHDGAGSSVTTITNNHVSGVIGTRGAIDTLLKNGATGTMKATIQGNIIDTLDQTNSFAGMYLQTGSNTGAGGDNNKSCLTIGGSTSALKNSIDVGANSGFAIATGIFIEQEGVSKVALPGYAGAAYDNTAVQNFIAPKNTVTGSNATTVTAIHDSASPAGGGYSGDCAAIGITRPGQLTEMKDAPTGESDSSQAQISESEDILRTARGQGHNDNVQKLRQAELFSLMQAALQRWQEAGISYEDLARLQAVTFEIADLPDNQLATATSTSVKIDETAAGYGWYLDSAPMTDEEFDVAVPNRELQTTEQSPAFGRMDLLTVVMRELGIAYKHGRKTVIKGLKPLMEHTLSPAVRRLPQSQKITLPTPVVGVADANQLSSTTNTSAEAGQNSTSLNHAASRTAGANSPAVPDVSVNIGTLPQSKSITIKFKAQIKSPLTVAAGSVCNQGTVTADGPISVMTTDPGPPSVNGPTCTPLDVADLQLTKSDSPDPVNAGSNLTYTLNFKNNGPSAANSVSLSDAVPANTTFVSVTTPAGWTRTDSVPSGGTGTLTWTKNADAANQETASFTVVVKVNSNVANGATITNSATVSSPKTDPDSSNNTAMATTTVQTRADLAMTNSDSPDPVIAGQNITYTVGYTNNGPSDAQTVQMSDAIPANTTFVSVTTPAGWTRTDSVSVGGTGTITFTKATSANGDTASFTLVVKVSPSTANGATITDNATASSATTDPTPGNDTGTATTTVNRSADLELTKSDSPDVSVNAGDNITYTLTLTNHGPSNSSTVVVSDATPANTTLVSASTVSPGWSRTDVVPSGGTGTITFAKSDVGDTEVATFTIVVNVNANAVHNSTITNTATRTTATTDPVNTNDSGTATTTVINQADLAVGKSDSPDPVTAGNNLTYTITVTNNGPGAATSASMSDAMPAGTTFVSVNTPSGWTRTDAVPVGGNGTISFTNPSVANGAQAIFTLVLQVSASTANGTTLTNHALVSCSNESDNSNNDSGAISTTVNTSADLEVTKTDSPDPVTAGHDLTYTVTVLNHGPSDAQTLTLKDTTPTGTTLVSATTPAGWSRVDSVPVGGTGELSYTATTLASGASSTFTIVVHVSASAGNGTTISNSATATTATSDPGSFSNTGTSSTTVATSADLEVTKSDSPDPVTAGSDLTYTINFKNNGPSDAQSVTVSDATPTGTTFVSVTTPAGWTRTDSVPAGGTGTISFSKSSVADQETASFTLVVHVNSDVATGTVIMNSATKSSTTSDPQNGNDTGTASTTVNTSADLEVTKSDAPDPVAAGSNLTYTITVLNHGPSDALSLGLSDTLPANTTFVSVTTPAGWTRTDAVPVGGTGTITFTATSLAANANSVFTLVVHVDVNTPHATVLTNNATATTTTPDPGVFSNTGTTTTTVNAQADLSITKDDLEDPVMLGSNVTYHIVIKNNGAGDAMSVVMTDKLPQSMAFVSATPSTGSCMQAAGTITCNLGDMANGAQETVDVVIQAITVNTISDTVFVSSNTADPVMNNNHDTETTRVVGFRKFTFTDPIITGGCASSVGTLLFTSPAPAGIQISFPDNSPFVDAISPITTVGGETSLQVTANTQIVTAIQLVNVTATVGSNAMIGRLKLLPVRITSLTFDQNPVVGGNVVTGTVTLTCPAPKDILVKLAYDKALVKPDVASFMIPMGQTMGQFTITTKHPLSQTIGTITASANGGYLRSTLTVTP
jgi:uncharacterized repeat protein (TIGR01451 family)